MSKIIFLAHNATDHTLTFAIDGKRYEYALVNPVQCDAALFMLRKASVGKAFAYVKRRGKLIESTHAA